MRRTFTGVWLIAIVVVLAGCAAGTRHDAQITQLQRTSSRIVLMPLDVELSEISVGGVAEPKAEWTHRALDLLTENLRAEERQMGLDLVELRDNSMGNTDEREQIIQLNKLHGAVGKSIMIHRVIKLPNKGERFDWSLGPEVKVIRDKTGADYALFVFLRDSYASDGRKVAMFAAAALGVSLAGGAQIGFASLVDLKTGQVVWFNQVARATGDLRTPEPAAETVKVLLTGFPK